MRRAFRGLNLGKRGAPPQYPKGGSIGQDEDGGLFYADYRGYDGTVTWVPMEWWRWWHKRRIIRDIQNGDDWYLYQIDR